MTEQPNEPNQPTDPGETEEEAEQPSDPTTIETPESFPREYVEKLRDESAKHRTRAQRADELAARLHVATVAATGRLADPTDLPFDEGLLDDPEALAAAIDERCWTASRTWHLVVRPATSGRARGGWPSRSTWPGSFAGSLREHSSRCLGDR